MGLGVEVRVGVAVGDPGVLVGGGGPPQAMFGKFPVATNAVIMQIESWK